MGPLAPPKSPQHDELEALIKEARQRQVRRRLLGAVGVAIAAARGERAVVSMRFADGLRLAMREGTPENIPIVPSCGEPKAPQTVLVIRCCG